MDKIIDKENRDGLAVEVLMPKADKFLLVVYGQQDELARAKDILKNSGHEVKIHSPADK